MMMKMEAMMMVPWLDGAGEEEFFFQKQGSSWSVGWHTQERKKDACREERRWMMDCSPLNQGQHSPLNNQLLLFKKNEKKFRK